MPKVIHLVLGKANPNRMNGVSKVAHYQATYLHKLGLDVEIWGITKTTKDPVVERAVPTKLFRAQSFIRGLDPSLLWAIEQAKGKVIFHIHGALVHDFYLVTQILREKKIPYVYTPHGAFNEVALRKNKLFKQLYISGFEKYILRHAKKVHLLGKSEFEHLSKLINLKNKVIIPNGQCLEELHFDFHPLQHKQHPVFGFCGRLDNYYKGLDLLIKGFHSYINKHDKGELWIVGDGPDGAKLEQQVIATNLSGRVLFLGAKYGQDKLNRIANMDFFVHPSHSEGSPTAVLEAAALEIPLLVTTGTNVGHLVDQYQCGIHIPDNKPNTIEIALTRFLKLYIEKAHLPMKKQAALMIHEQFSWNRVAQQLAEVYRS